MHVVNDELHTDTFGRNLKYRICCFFKFKDTHVYYKSWNKTDVATGQHYWVDVDSKPDTIKHQMLSQSYRRAVVI